MIEIQDKHWNRILNNDGMPKKNSYRPTSEQARGARAARKDTVVLSDEQREQVKAMHEVGTTMDEIRKHFKCSKTAVFNIIHE